MSWGRGGRPAPGACSWARGVEQGVPREGEVGQEVAVGLGGALGMFSGKGEAVGV